MSGALIVVHLSSETSSEAFLLQKLAHPGGSPLGSVSRGALTQDRLPGFSCLRQTWQRGTSFQRYGSRYCTGPDGSISLRFLLEFLARWVSEVVVKGYATRDLAAPSHRAYELRAWSAYLALKHSVPIQYVLEAAYW